VKIETYYTLDYHTPPSPSSLPRYLNPTALVELPALLSIYKARLGLSFPVPDLSGLSCPVPALEGEEFRLASKYPAFSGAKCQSASALSRMGDGGGDAAEEAKEGLLRKGGAVSIQAITSVSSFSSLLGASETPLRAASE